VPLPKVRGISEEEMFKVVSTGKKTQKKGWKRMVTKPTFVGQDFTSEFTPTIPDVSSPFAVAGSMVVYGISD
jgi:hypothetical protein